jgi:hypothetical protein
MDEADYSDRWIRCTPDRIEVRAYYFPWGTKHIDYGSIRGIERVSLSAGRGRARIWGTANPGYWANLDPDRPRKAAALVLDLGKRVMPFLTPDDPNRFEAVVRAHAGLGPEAPTRTVGKAPLI